MFKEWSKTVSALNSNRNKANIEKAKKLRKKYIIIGLILKIFGVLSVITTVSLFITFSIIHTDGISVVTIVSSLLFPPSAFLIGIGATYSRLGKRIDIILEQPNVFIDLNNINNNKCPYCGDIINQGELFCSNCGKKLDNTCPKCGYANDVNNNFCEKCGEDLRY